MENTATSLSPCCLCSGIRRGTHFSRLDGLTKVTTEAFSALAGVILSLTVRWSHLGTLGKYPDLRIRTFKVEPRCVRLNRLHCQSCWGARTEDSRLEFRGLTLAMTWAGRARVPDLSSSCCLRSLGSSLALDFQVLSFRIWVSSSPTGARRLQTLLKDKPSAGPGGWLLPCPCPCPGWAAWNPAKRDDRRPRIVLLVHDCHPHILEGLSGREEADGYFMA